MDEKILVVDDEESLRLSMKFKLRAAGFDVDVAVDGEEALEKLKSQPVDVVLLDINMPRMSGIEALTIIRQQYPQTETIMLTGFADFTTAIECLKIGARDYLVKPVDTTELVTRLRSLLRSRSSERALVEVQRQYTSLLIDDLLDPLRKIQTLLERMGRLGGTDAKERKDLIAEAQELGDRMAKKVELLVEFAKREFEKGGLEGSPVDVQEIADRLKTIRDGGS